MAWTPREEPSDTGLASDLTPVAHLLLLFMCPYAMALGSCAARMYLCSSFKIDAPIREGKVRAHVIVVAYRRRACRWTTDVLGCIRTTYAAVRCIGQPTGISHQQMFHLGAETAQARGAGQMAF